MSLSVSTPLRLRLAADAVASLHRASRAVYPDEGCGILLGRFEHGGQTVVTQVVVTPNQAGVEARARRYEIDPKLLLHWDRIAQKSGLSIVGFFHSHPDAEPHPSATDAALAWPGYVYVIVGVSKSAGGAGQGSALVNGMAAWTFDDASTTFTEVSVKVDIAEDQIEYFI